MKLEEYNQEKDGFQDQYQKIKKKFNSKTLWTKSEVIPKTKIKKIYKIIIILA